MQLPPNNLKAPPFQQMPVIPLNDYSRAMEDYCRIHRKARINQFQTPLWCDRYANCLACLMEFANTNPPQPVVVVPVQPLKTNTSKTPSTKKKGR